MLVRIIPPAVALVLFTVLVVLGGRMLAGPPDDPLAPADFVIDDSDLAVLDMEAEPLPEVAPSMQDDPVPEAVPAAPSAMPDEAETEPELFPEQAPAEITPLPPAGELSEPQSQDDGSRPTAASRLVEPALIAPLHTGVETLQRELPREPLGPLGQALPPPPSPPPPETISPDLAGKPLFRPVALESAVFESGGNRVSIAGVKSIAPDESCTYEGVSWSCGVRARAAVRLWLRGRALVCEAPDQAGAAGCRLATQDVGAWLVENGWALAAPDGPYAAAGEQARVAKRGVFGAPPDASSLPELSELPVPGSGSSSGTALPGGPIMTEGSADPQPSTTDPRMVFPPAPPAP